MNRRNLFIAFAAFALCFFASSCVKEEGFENRVREIIGTGGETRIATLEEQVKEMRNSITQLQSAQEKLEQYAAKLGQDLEAAKTDIATNAGKIATLETELAGVKTSISAIQQSIATIEKGLSDLSKHVDDTIGSVRTWVEGTFATIETTDKIAAGLAAAEKRIQNNADSLKNFTDTVYTTVYSKVRSEISDSLASAEKRIQSWVLDTLTKGYWTIAQTQVKLDAVEKKALDSIGVAKSDLQTQIDSARAQLTRGYNAAIKQSITEYDGEIRQHIADTLKSVNDKIDAVTNSINTLTARVTNLEKDIVKLVARIQKIDVIPDYSDGSVELMESDSNVLSFAVRPYAAIKELVDLDSTELFNVVVKGTYTKADADIDTLEIQRLWLDEGILKIRINTAKIKLNKNFYKMTSSLSACMSIDDGNTSMTSGFFTLTPMVSYPEAPDQRCVYIKGSWWAPVNCGYDENHKYGLLYQWGRKVGTGYDGESGVLTIENGQTSSSEEDTTKFYVNPGITMSSDIDLGKFWHWIDENDLDERWDPEIRGDYDPCPKGWRVPNERELTSLIGGGIGGIGEIKINRNINNVEDTVISYVPDFWLKSHNGQEGFWFDGTNAPTEGNGIFLPAAGIRYFDKNGSCIYRDGNRLRYICYWSSSYYTAFKELEAEFYFYTVSLTCIWNSYYGTAVDVTELLGSSAIGMPVRCVKAF